MAKLIRLATRSQVNHAFVVVTDARIVEARFRGATISPLSTYDRHFVVYNDLEPFRDATRSLIARSALDLVGTGYGFLDIVVLALTTFGIRWQWAARRVESTRSLICSQLADRAYLNAGVHLFDDGRLTGSVTPGDLLLRDAEAPWVSR